MDKSKERALSLLRKAREDLYAADSLSKDEKASLWTVGFHVQQAIEKSLKAALMHQGVRYPFTHDLAALIKLAQQQGLSVPANSEDLPYLTPFGTLFRYEDEEWGLPDTLNAKDMLSQAEIAVEWARRILEDTSTPRGDA